MNRYLLLLVIIVATPDTAFAGLYKCRDADGEISFSDSACSNAEAEEIGFSKSKPNSNQQPEHNSSGNGVYTKDLSPMQAPDAATQSCFKYVNTTARFPDPTSTKLLSSTKKWVSVKGVGARQMVTISATSKNEGGMYVGIQLHNCLLMGDGLTINTYPYELL
jgi:hypothetical protein